MPVHNGYPPVPTDYKGVPLPVIWNPFTYQWNVMATGGSGGGGEPAETPIRIYPVGVGGAEEFKVVWIDTEGKVHLADSRDEQQFGRVVGVALDTRTDGQTVRVQRKGYVERMGWGLDVESYLLGADGELVKNPVPGARFIQEIGFGINNGTLAVRLSEPILLASDEQVPEESPVSGTTDRAYTVGAGGVNAGQIVFLTSHDTVAVADAENASHFARVLGFALDSRDEGQTVRVRRQGYVFNTTWSLVPGVCYAGVGGGIVSSAGEDFKWVQVVGIAINEKTMAVNVGIPTKIG